ncbi:hypothetical protein N9B17_03145 [Rhodopirellula sp.]|nr:hypothetical protein [Rhodopirellula sp.]
MSKWAERGAVSLLVQGRRWLVSRVASAAHPATPGSVAATNPEQNTIVVLS